MADSDLPQDFFARLNAGSRFAAEEIDRRYRSRLCALVAKEMGKRIAQREDPDDPVQSALRSFFRGIDEDRFVVDHESNLWRLLATITRHKMLKHIERHTAERRDPDAEVPDQADRLPCREPGPLDAVVAMDLLDRLIQDLPAADAEILRLRLEGYTRTEIASRMQCSEPMVKQRLSHIRDCLRKVISADEQLRFGEI
jgi:RNA polymerase sigma factor (sigma-70 family)